MIRALTGLATGAAAGARAPGAGGAARPVVSFSAELAARTNPRPAATVRAAGSTGLAFTPGWEEPPVGAGEAARLRWAAEQLEALFLEQLWRGMRRTVIKTGMLDGPGVDLFEEMLDQERARAMAAAGALGLADMVYEQMSRYIVDDSNGRTVPGRRVNM
ncbi:MAG: rod-binding protein [Limnochordales bacterium]